MDCTSITDYRLEVLGAIYETLIEIGGERDGKEIILEDEDEELGLAVEVDTSGNFGDDGYSHYTRFHIIRLAAARSSLTLDGFLHDDDVEAEYDDTEISTDGLYHILEELNRHC